MKKTLPQTDSTVRVDSQRDLSASPQAGIFFEALEPRVLFSAAPVEAEPPAETGEAPESVQMQVISESATAQDSHEETPEVTLDVELVGETTPVQLAFVNADLPDLDTLLEGIDPSIQTVLLDHSSDGFGQVASYLSGQSNIGAIHFLGHGSPGELMIGNSVLNEASILEDYGDELNALRDSLTESGEIFFYGCDVAGTAEGESTLRLISDFVAADVAASSDATGAANLGGDWDLEFRLGTFEVQGLAPVLWSGLLGPAVPAVDLDASEAGTGYSADYTENGSAVAIVNTDVDISDADDATVESVTITPGDITDGADESLIFNGDGASSITVDLDGAAAATQQITINGSVLDVDYDGTDLTVTDSLGGSISHTDAETLLAGIRYEDTATPPTAGTRTFSISVNDGTSDSVIAQSQIQVVRDYIGVASNTLTTDENTPVSLGISVAPDLLLGGALEDIVGTAIGYRAATAGATPTGFTIPGTATGIVITAYSNLPTDTGADDLYNDDYQTLTARIDLATQTSSGTLARIINVSNGGSRVADQYSWSNADLDRKSVV